jgi:hypothetical protein
LLAKKLYYNFIFFLNHVIRKTGRILREHDMRMSDGETLPCLYKEAIQFRRHLGFDYDKNSCMFFWKKHAYKVVCSKCNTSRWVDHKGKKSKISQKVLRYFPIKSRL